MTDGFYTAVCMVFQESTSSFPERLYRFPPSQATCEQFSAAHLGQRLLRLLLETLPSRQVCGGTSPWSHCEFPYHRVYLSATCLPSVLKSFSRAFAHLLFSLFLLLLLLSFRVLSIL